MTDFASSPSGSAKEILASKRIQELRNALDEKLVNSNHVLVAAFENDEIGFCISASEAIDVELSKYTQDDDSDEDDSDEDEPSLQG